MADRFTSLNRYPIWKYLLIVIVLGSAVFYALPNVYPEVPAVQVSHSSGNMPAAAQQQIEAALDKAGLKDFTIEHQQATGNLLIRLPDASAQLQAAEHVKRELPENYVVALNLASNTPHWLASIGAQPMNLGLDLRGGVYFLLAVDTQAAIEKSLIRYQDDFQTYFREAKIRYRDISVKKDKLKVELRTAQAKEKAAALISRRFPDAFVFDETTEALSLSMALSEQETKDTIDAAVQQNVITLRKRVNELGVAEPVVARQGFDRIVVQLPGVQDTARAKEILGATATLEFRLVEEGSDAGHAQRTGRIPRNARLYFERSGAPVLLKREVMLTGEYIIDAASGIDGNTARPAVFITLDGKGARIFSRVTSENVKRLMGVVFIENKTETYRDEDGNLQRRSRKVEEVINVARIQEKLSKRFQITGLDSSGEARKLALLLRAGALAAPLEIVEERTVGPSLGQENIDKGKRSIMLAFLLVVLFMGIYYRVFGLIADLALTANIFLIVAAMSLIPGATLTLPGIVGIVLTVGMAVDANVLIFERIREELTAGNSPHAGIDAGYRRAFATIADANVTTLIAALVLFVFGSGPIKGFAVTLSLGILSSMFTSIMGTRAAVNLIYGNQKKPDPAI